MIVQDGSRMEKQSDVTTNNLKIGPSNAEAVKKIFKKTLEAMRWLLAEEAKTEAACILQNKKSLITGCSTPRP